MDLAKIKEFTPVILESPFRNPDPEQFQKNLDYLNMCIHHSITQCKEAPFASHRMYTSALDDDKSEERRLGIMTGLRYHYLATKQVVYVDLGISDGMMKGMEFASKIGLPIEFRRLL